MTLEQLKTRITNREVQDIKTVVFKDKERFISMQYIKAIAEILNKDIVYYDEYSKLCQSFGNAWIPNTFINVYKCTEFNEQIPTKAINTFIICDKTDIPCVEVPKLEKWQILEYIKINVDIDEQKLYNICKGNIFRIQNEIEKLKLFPLPKQVFDELIEEGQYSDLGQDDVIWDYITALFKKDVNKIREVMPGIITGANDVTDFYLLTSLYNKLIKVIKVQLSPNPTPQSTGLTDKQIWACKKYDCGWLSTEQLYKIFDKVSELDALVKRGEFNTEWMVDYLTVLFLGR